MDFITELKPQYDNRASFYGKALVIDDGEKTTLRSYSTNVAEIRDGKVTVFGTYSMTTLRHIKDFLQQNGFTAENKKQIEEDYIKA